MSPPRAKPWRIALRYACDNRLKPCPYKVPSAYLNACGHQQTSHPLCRLRQFIVAQTPYKDNSLRRLSLTKKAQSGKICPWVKGVALRRFFPSFLTSIKKEVPARHECKRKLTPCVYFVVLFLKHEFTHYYNEERFVHTA